MLSTTNQLDAYKELTSAGGMTTPPSIEKSVDVVTNAAAISTLLTGLFLSTVEYPATISTSTAQISSWASLLSELAKSADAREAVTWVCRSIGTYSALYRLGCLLPR